MTKQRRRYGLGLRTQLAAILMLGSLVGGYFMVEIQRAEQAAQLTALQNHAAFTARHTIPLTCDRMAEASHLHGALKQVGISGLELSGVIGDDTHLPDCNLWLRLAWIAPSGFLAPEDHVPTTLEDPQHAALARYLSPGRMVNCYRHDQLQPHGFVQGTDIKVFYDIKLPHYYLCLLIPQGQTLQQDGYNTDLDIGHQLARAGIAKPMGRIHFTALKEAFQRGEWRGNTGSQDPADILTVLEAYARL